MRREKGRRRPELAAGSRITNYFPKIVCTKEWAREEKTRSRIGAKRKRRLEDDGEVELDEGRERMKQQLVPEETRNMKLMMDGNLPDETTDSGGPNSFLGKESSAERKTTDGHGKGANWEVWKGIIGSKMMETPRGLRQKKRKT